MSALLSIAFALAMVQGAPAACAKPAEHEVRRDFNRFVDLLMVERDARKAFETYATPGLVNHNPAFGADRASTIAQWNTMITPSSTFSVKGVSIEGGIGVVRFRSYLTPNTRGASVTNYYRFDCGKIVETWDVLDTGL